MAWNPNGTGLAQAGPTRYARLAAQAAPDQPDPGLPQGGAFDQMLLGAETNTAMQQRQLVDPVYQKAKASLAELLFRGLAQPAIGAGIAGIGYAAGGADAAIPLASGFAQGWGDTTGQMNDRIAQEQVRLDAMANRQAAIANQGIMAENQMTFQQQMAKQQQDAAKARQAMQIAAQAAEGKLSRASQAELAAQQLASAERRNKESVGASRYATWQQGQIAKERLSLQEQEMQAQQFVETGETPEGATMSPEQTFGLVMRGAKGSAASKHKKFQESVLTATPEAEKRKAAQAYYESQGGDPVSLSPEDVDKYFKAYVTKQYPVKAFTTPHEATVQKQMEGRSVDTPVPRPTPGSKIWEKIKQDHMRRIAANPSDPMMASQRLSVPALEAVSGYLTKTDAMTGTSYAGPIPMYSQQEAGLRAIHGIIRQTYGKNNDVDAVKFAYQALTDPTTRMYWRLLFRSDTGYDLEK